MGLVAGLVVRRGLAAAAGALGALRGVAQERGRAVGREDAQVGARRGQAGEHELRGLVRCARGRRLDDLDDVGVEGRVGRAVVPVVHFQVVRGVAVGVAQAGLEELLLGRGEGPGGRDADAADAYFALLARLGLERDAVAHRREVVDVLAGDALGVREDLDVDVEFHFIVGALVADGVDRGPRAVEVRVDLDGLQIAQVLREGEVVLDLVPRVHVDAGAGLDLRADHGAGRNHVVRHGLEGRRDLAAARGRRERVRLVVLAEGVVELDSVGARDGEARHLLAVGVGVAEVVARLGRRGAVGARVRRVHVLEQNARRRRADRHVDVVDVEGVEAVLAHLGLAGRARVAGLALAAHRDLGVPQIVDVAVVRGGEVLRAHADAVARARRVAAGRLLAARAGVAREAVALAGLAVADALVAALGVGVARVRERGARRVDHEGVLLRRAVGVDGRASDDDVGRARPAQRVGGAVEVALGRVDVRRHEGAGPPGAVGLLPVRVADALVERAAGAVAGAGVRALGDGRAGG